MHEIDKGGGRRLLVGYTDDRARKDSYNRNKGVRRLEKLYKRGHLTKESINKRGYNKFLDMSGDTTVVINRERIAQDAAWDGLVPLHTQAHRGARLHLLRGLEVLQRAGAQTQGRQYRHERRQGAEHGKDCHHHRVPTA